MSIKRTFVAVVASMAAVVATPTGAQAMSFDEWGSVVDADSILGTSTSLNTAALEGCSFVAQRDDILYFASNRSGGHGGLDIWYSLRNADGTWGDPVNFDAVNSTADELCPTAHRNGKTFLFVSKRPGYCGVTANYDLYATRLHATRGWSEPQNLGCTVNSTADEAGPYLLEDQLYFSSMRPGAGGSDIYVSAFNGASFGTASAVTELNTASNDYRPNLRRDGLEIFFDSNRSGSIVNIQGNNSLDLWTSTRASTSDPWSAPTNMGAGVNSGGDDLRPTLSWDATTLYFGSTRSGGEGSQDLYVITRDKLK